MESAADHNENPASQRLENLEREMGRAAEAIEADGRAAPALGALDRAKTNYPGAKQRRRIRVANQTRKRIGKVLAQGGELRITAVMVPSGEARIGAEILAFAPAIRTYSAGLTQPCDPDAYAGFESSAARAHSLYHSYNFMAGDDTRTLRLKVALRDMQIGPAYATTFDTDEDFARTRLRRGDIDET